MTQYRFILNAFGLGMLKPLLYVPGTSLESGDSGFEQQQGSEIKRSIGDVEHPSSQLGTPIFDRLTITGENDSITLDTVLITVNQQRNIAKTNITGRNGSIKEYISDGDYDIAIKAVLTDSNPTRYPSDQVKTLVGLCRERSALKLDSGFLLLFDILEGVVTNYTIRQAAGLQNVQLVEIDMISDEPLILVED